MSKKRKRYANRHPKHPKRKSIVDAHHLCFTRRNWNQGAVKALRQCKYCIMTLPKDTLHKAIHDGMSAVPPPREIGAKTALAQIRMLYQSGAIDDRDPLEKRLQLLASLFDYSDQPTADGFRKQLRIVQGYTKKPP